MNHRPGATQDDVREPEVGLTIEQASRMVDLPIPTIRSWERRHKVPSVTRTPGGHRRYTRDQLATLRRMRDLVAQGVRPVDAAARVKAEGATSAEALVERLLQAAQDLQPDRIGDVLDAAHQVLGLGRTADEVLLPAMRQVGDWWQSGHADVSREHLASNAIRAWLSQVRRTGVPPTRAPITLSCGPSDDHTLALEALAALLRERGCDCRLLGARTPADSLARAVRDTAAAAVVVVCHLPAGRQAAVDAIRLVQRDHQIHIFYAGGAFASHRAREGVPGRYLGENLSQAAEAIIKDLSLFGAAPVAERSEKDSKL